MSKKSTVSRIILLMVVVLILELIPLAVRARISLKYCQEWGLGYQENGQQPIGNEDNEYLKQFNACYVGSPNDKVIYLTFDAGYENGYTEKLLDVLKKHQVPAAFFLVGHYLKSNPELVNRMVDEGHIIGNHTYSHPDMTIQNFENFKEELEDFEALYKEVVGEEMLKYYRAPAGKYSENNLKYANTLGYKTIFWSLAYFDWDNDKQPSKEIALSKILPRTHPGAIVLLHSTSKTNSETLDDMLTYWEEEGYRFKSLEDLQIK